MVKVYSTNACPWCVKAKNYLKSVGVAFEEFNVQEDMNARDEMINNGSSCFRYRWYCYSWF